MKNKHSGQCSSLSTQETSDRFCFEETTASVYPVSRVTPTTLIKSQDAPMRVQKQSDPYFKSKDKLQRIVQTLYLEVMSILQNRLGFQLVYESFCSPSVSRYQV